MISSLDMKAFGKQLADIRHQAQVTQREVYELTGLSEDTLRRIEQGRVIPKYETLSILSEIYKVNLSAILSAYNKDTRLEEIVRVFDEVIAKNPKSMKGQLVRLRAEVESYANSSQSNSVDLDLLRAFLNITAQLTMDEPGDWVQLIEELTKAMGKTIPGFDIKDFQSYRYSELDLRLLLLAGLVYHKHSRYNEAIPILEFALDYLKLTKTETDLASLMIEIKLYYNLSYAAYKLEDDEASLNYANLGIELCRDHYFVYSLEFLLVRKAIAEYFLKKSDFMDSFARAIHLLKATDNHEMIHYIVTTIKDSHGIDLSPLV